MSNRTNAALSSLGLRAGLVGRTALQRADQLAARLAPKDRPGLLVFVFHCLFADQAEADEGVIDPHERATPEGLSRMFDYFRGHGYRFVSAAEIDAGLQAGGLYAHLTFDDGFANNLRLLDLLAREEAYATVFPSVNHVRDGKAYWWNALYRERHRRGQGAALAAESFRLRPLSLGEADRYLLSEFGPRALEPVGDVDRPLTVSELREMARSPWIEIGNHTLDHAVLTSCPPAEAEAQIAGAQQWLQGVIGSEPFFIAYPNGDANREVEGVSRRLGLRLGVTVTPGRNAIPASPQTRMRLGRFRIVFDGREEAQMRAARSAVQLAAAARQLVLRSG